MTRALDERVSDSITLPSPQQFCGTLELLFKGAIWESMVRRTPSQIEDEHRNH
jgi:hypothetical protein